MSALVLTAVIWFLTGLAIAVPIGKAMKVADAREAADRAETVRRHPSALALSDAEVERQIRQLEHRWTA